MDIVFFFQSQPTWFYPLVFILGACIGSFLNVVISRLPALVDNQIAKADGSPLPNLIKPASRCPRCKHPISAFHNIPLLSYLLLKGKCAYCQKSISAQYFIVELICAILFTLIAWVYGPSLLCLAYFVFTALLICLAFIDLNTWLLPDVLTLTGLLIGLAVNATVGPVSLLDSALGGVIGYSILWLIFKIHFRITNRQGMGYGDFKLFAMLGAWLGWQALPLVLLISSTSALVIFLALKLTINFDYKQAIPFGPFLTIAAWIYLIGRSFFQSLLIS